MKVLVTGAKGFIGKYLVAELKNRKREVVEFDLADGKNILDKEQVRKALKGIDVVIHLAAIVENNNPKLWEVNVEGTRTLVEEAAKAKIGRLVLLSSTGVYGFTKKPVNEESEVNAENTYEKSKLEAEKIVLAAQEEISTSIVRSAMVFGANDYWRRMFKLLEKNYPLPCKGKNHFQVMYAADLANALITVAERGDAGELYLVAGEEAWTLNEFCAEGKKALGVNGKMKHVPMWLAIVIGKMFRMKVMTKENIRHLSKERLYDISKIKKLGYKQTRTLRDAMNETILEIRTTV